MADYKFSDFQENKCDIRQEIKFKKKLNACPTCVEDPNYILNAELNHNVYRDREKIIINGEINLPSKIYIFYLNNKNEVATLLFPNKFENKINFSGKFVFPTNNNYDLVANFPLNHNKDTIMENITIDSLNN